MCSDHGEFLQIPKLHLSGSGCPSCAFLDPKWQQKVRDFIKNVYSGEVLYNNRTTIKHQNSKKFLELDIFLPQIKIAFECQGVYFHDDTKFPGIAKKDKAKAQLCLEAGITLICVWENEWNDPKKRILIENQIKDTISSK